MMKFILFYYRAFSAQTPPERKPQPSSNLDTKETLTIHSERLQLKIDEHFPFLQRVRAQRVLSRSCSAAGRAARNKNHWPRLLKGPRLARAPLWVPDRCSGGPKGPLLTCAAEAPASQLIMACWMLQKFSTEAGTCSSAQMAPRQPGNELTSESFSQNKFRDCRAKNGIVFNWIWTSPEIKLNNIVPISRKAARN